MFNSILDFVNAKNEGRPISMITCYDYSSARLLCDTDVDCLLVGDSVAMVMHGFDSTVHANIEMMEAHIAAVRRGVGAHGFIIGDMPFLEHRKGVAHAVEIAGRLIRAGANAVKLEGVHGHKDVITAIVQAGIPVMGHLGLTPQSVHAFGGYKVQGKDDVGHKRIVDAAAELEDAGCFSIVLECVPSGLASEIHNKVNPVLIGIGAGTGVDGQVLVWQDALGLNIDFKPKFVRTFSKLGEQIKSAVNDYDKAVKSGDFPSSAEEFK